MNDRRDAAENDQIKTTGLNEDGREKNPKSMSDAVAGVAVAAVVAAETRKRRDVDGWFQRLRDRGVSWG